MQNTKGSSNLTADLRILLEDQSDPKTRDWWEGYVKNSAPFLGVKMARIRSTVHQWHRAQISGRYDLDQQLEIALHLFGGKFTEEKLAGILFLQEILIPAGGVHCSNDLDKFAGLFTSRLIYDWNVCDWFSIKVLGSLLKREGTACAKGICTWHLAENLWQARSSLVAFVPVAGEGKFYPMIENSCKRIVQREERFAKTAVGWILRDISKVDQAFVDRVIRQNIKYFSPESLKNASKYFPPQEKNAYLKLRQDAQVNG